MLDHKLDKAYEHATNVEATVCYKDSIVWYQLLCELLTKCKQAKSSDWSFWFLYITALDRYARLCLKEQGSHIKKSVMDATQAVFKYVIISSLCFWYDIFTKQNVFQFRPKSERDEVKKLF